MRHAKIKNLISKAFILALAAVFTAAQFPILKASATESCFEGVGATIVPYPGVLLTKIRARCEMKLYYMDATFANTKTFEGISGDFPTHLHEQMTGVDDSRGRYQMWWNKDEDDPDTDDGRPYIDVLPGEDLFGMQYGVHTGTTIFKRNIPITITSARYEINGEMKTEENVTLDALVTVNPDDSKEVLMVSGVEKQDLTYTGQPAVLDGELTIEENGDNITVEDLNDLYYVFNDSIPDYVPVSHPTEPGDYVVDYTFENDHYRASLRVPFTIKDYATVSLEILYGHGEMSAPQYVDVGDDLHVDIEPAEGYEIFWVDYNRRDVTDLLNADDSLDLTNITSDVKIEVAFRPVYEVTKGSGAKHIIGKEDNLDFVIDKDPDSYNDGIMTMMVDDNYIDMENDVVVNPAARTITLLGKYLDTLEPGEHQLEIFFFDTDIHGVARATFITSEEEDEDDPILIPDTGANTTKTSSSTKIFNAPAIIALLSIATISAFLLKRQIKSLRQGR